MGDVPRAYGAPPGPIDRYLDGFERGRFPLEPGPLTRTAFVLMVVPALLFSVLPFVLGPLSSLALLPVPAALAVHVVGLRLLRYGEAPREARIAWWTWLLGVGAGIAAGATSVLYGLPSSFDPTAPWGTVPAPGLAWAVLFPLVPTSALAATVRGLWPFADRAERLVLSWAVVGSAFGLATLLLLGTLPGGRVPGPVGILVALGVGGPVLVAAVGRMLWRTRYVGPLVAPLAPAVTFERV